jgi:hypothetical protein
LGPFAEVEQLGVHVQLRAFGGFHVYFEADVTAIDKEIEALLPSEWVICEGFFGVLGACR